MQYIGVDSSVVVEGYEGSVVPSGFSDSTMCAVDPAHGDVVEDEVDVDPLEMITGDVQLHLVLGKNDLGSSVVGVWHEETGLKVPLITPEYPFLVGFEVGSELVR